MRFSYSLENLRRLASTPPIEIRPITILLGRNSVGKSTFLRSFPLLKQSVETKSSAPILWYGDFVDFGDFKSAVSNNDLNKEIAFKFEFKDYSGKSRFKNPIYYRINPSLDRPRSISIDQLKITYKVGLKAESTGRTSIYIELPMSQSNIELNFDTVGSIVSSVKLNGIEMEEFSSTYLIYMEHGSLFSEPNFLIKKRENKKTRYLGISRDRAFLELIERELTKLVDGRTSKKRISSEARRILRFKSLTDDDLETLSSAETETFRRIYKKMINTRTSKLRLYLNSMCEANYLFDVLQSVGESLDDFYSSVKYINPARAQSERFYRQQELEVSDIYPDGRNLSMFLASLDFSEMRNFSDWVKHAFGYGVKVHKAGGHISIYLEQRGQSVNVVDTGYGVSQVLPVLAQVWWMRYHNRDRKIGNRNSGFNIKTLTIEQPELHLHPAHQALLADVFVEAQDASNTEDGVSQYYIIETHSEALVNRMGELIEDGKIDAKDVQIVIFGDSSGDVEQSDVTIAEFDKKGVLQNWPYGFFNIA